MLQQYKLIVVKMSSCKTCKELQCNCKKRPLGTTLDVELVPKLGFLKLKINFTIIFVMKLVTSKNRIFY